MKQQCVFFDEWFIPHVLYAPIRQNGETLDTLMQLLKQVKPESPYKYKDAIHKNVKYELTKSEWCKNDALVDYIADNSTWEEAIKEYNERLYREVSHQAYKIAVETGLPYNEAFGMVVKEISERMYKNESKK